MRSVGSFGAEEVALSAVTKYLRKASFSSALRVCWPDRGVGIHAADSPFLGEAFFVLTEYRFPSSPIVNRPASFCSFRALYDRGSDNPFIWPNRSKSEGARSGQYGGSGALFMPLSGRKSNDTGAMWRRVLSTWTSNFRWVARA
jgi:hypothetical protein